MEEVKVLKIKSKKSYLIKAEHLESWSYLLNGQPISEDLKKSEIVFSENDKLQYLSRCSTLIDYRRGSEIITTKEYNAKPQSYYENDPEEKVLRALANKKELSGFKAYYEKPKPEDVKLKIIGYIEDTNSLFIHSSVTSRFSSKGSVYFIEGSRIALNQYNKLKEEHKDQGRFEEPRNDSLEYISVNGKSCFGTGYPFSKNHYEGREIFICLEDAKEEESRIRNLISNIVNRVIFSQKLTEVKAVSVLSQLKSAKKMKTKKTKDELLNIVIKELNDYVNQIS